MKVQNVIVGAGIAGITLARRLAEEKINLYLLSNAAAILVDIALITERKKVF